MASAQSSVTLFGTLDASISSVSNKSKLYVSPADVLANLGNPWAYYGLPGSIKASQTGLANSRLSSSALGFRGTEDLGGGLWASFHLESDVFNDDGSGGLGAFNRRSTLSLGGNFGELRLGRDYKPTFWNLSSFSAFGTNGAGTSLLQRGMAGFEGDNVRASNTIGYHLPGNLGGFYGQVMFAFHERVKYDNDMQGTAVAAIAPNPALNIAGNNGGSNNSRGGRYWGGRFGYANGPLNVAAAYGEQILTSSWSGGWDSRTKNFNVGATYDFGVVKLFGQANSVKNKRDYNGLTNTPTFNPATKLTGYAVGMQVPVGAGLVRASYGRIKIKADQNPWLPSGALNTAYFDYQAQKADQLALGYVHNLSKRTALYATVAYIKNKNGMAASVGGNSIAPAFVTGTQSFTNPLTGTAVSGTYQASTSIGYDLGIRHSF